MDEHAPKRKGSPPAYGLGRFPLERDATRATCEAPCCRHPPTGQVAWLHYGTIYTASLCGDCMLVADQPTLGVDVGGPLT